MNQDRQRRDIERLEHKRQMLNQRLDTQRARINERIDQKQAELGGKLNLRQEQIIAAALELLSAQGLANLSLREIAKRLDMRAPALYWYFKNKEVLVDFMAEAILQKEFKDLRPRQENQTWQDWLVDHMSKLRKAMLAYPDGARVVAGAHLYPAESLARSLETALVSLHSAGVDLQTARRIVTTATTYTFGYVIEEQAAPKPEDLAGVDLEDFLTPYPNLAKVATAATRARESVDEDFMTGLQYIMKGSTQA
jgi:AcrR family transcriptional regulator